MRILALALVFLFFTSTSFSNSNHDSGVPAEKALQWLKNGNTRYLKNTNRKDGKGNKERIKLSSGQHPHTVVISCSDSRVPPEIVFDQGLGEIFVIRSAGEDIDYTEIASAEYAIDHLGPKLILVMGHTSCGAVKAALDTKPGTSAGSPSLDKLVQAIQPRISGVESSKDLSAESMANAKAIARELLEKSPLLKEMSEKGKIKIVPALYDLTTGKIKWDM